MKTRGNRRQAAVLACLAALLLGGCARPEGRAGLTPDWQEATAAAVEPVLIPRDLEPEPAAGLPAVEPGRPLSLSVEQAIWLSLANNQELRARRMAPIIAGTFEAIERGAYDAELFGEAEVGQEKSLDPEGSVLAPLEEEDRSVVVGLRQRLPTGTTVEGSLAQEMSDTDREPREESARVVLTVTQALLRGAGPLVNLVSVRQAELNTAASAYELRGVTEVLLADTEIAYWEYVLAGQKIDIFEESLAIALRQLDEIEQRIEVGILPRIEAAAAHAEVARRRQALIDARSTLEAARLRLVRLLNPAGDGRLDFAVAATSAAGIEPAPIIDLGERLGLAERSRADLAEARLRMRQNRLEIIATKNGLLPRLDLFISLGKTGYAESFGDSFRNLEDSGHDAAVGLRLSHSLDNRQARARELAARASWQQAREAVENLRQIVDLDVRLAINEVERARRQISATSATRLLQEETLAAEKERFDVGASTALLVAQAQRDLLASAIVEVEAVVNYRKALVNLYLAEGSLLERRGVSLAAP